MLEDVEICRPLRRSDEAHIQLPAQCSGLSGLTGNSEVGVLRAAAQRCTADGAENDENLTRPRQRFVPPT